MDERLQQLKRASVLDPSLRHTFFNQAFQSQDPLGLLLRAVWWAHHPQLLMAELDLPYSGRRMPANLTGVYTHEGNQFFIGPSMDAATRRFNSRRGHRLFLICPMCLPENGLEDSVFSLGRVWQHALIHLHPWSPTSIRRKASWIIGLARDVWPWPSRRNPDEQNRSVERSFEAQGEFEQQVKIYAERLRRGQLSLQNVGAAALLHHPVAVAILGKTPKTDFTLTTHFPHVIVSPELDGCLPESAYRRYAIDIAKYWAHWYEEATYDTSRLKLLLEVAEKWSYLDDSVTRNYLLTQRNELPVPLRGPETTCYFAGIAYIVAQAATRPTIHSRNSAAMVAEAVYEQMEVVYDEAELADDLAISRILARARVWQQIRFGDYLLGIAT